MNTQDKQACRAVADLYHSFLTGLILALLVRRDESEVADLVFRLFRQKHLDQFLRGMEKLGLRQDDRNLLPDAVACAQYHYLSNFLGGVGVEYIPESDRKAWIRYPPPRWIWKGVAIAAIPSSVSAAMLRGWHGHNGVTLGNKKLGFVCTKQTVDGQPGLEGYYYEYDHELDENERLRFAPEEQAPAFNPGDAPPVPSASWPEERLEKANRNYAMDYVATLLPIVFDSMGCEQALPITIHVARVIALQEYEGLLETMEMDRSSDFEQVFKRLVAAQGDTLTSKQQASGTVLQQTGWRLFADAPRKNVEACFETWKELWIGCALAHDRFGELSVANVDLEHQSVSWRYEKGTS